MENAEPKGAAPWYKNGLAIFFFVIIGALVFAHVFGSGENKASQIAVQSPDIDSACLNEVDDDTALMFDSDVELGRLKACDRSTDRVVLPPELAATVDDLSGDSGNTFHGYDCSGDCSGHLAGFEWAADHRISDPEKCSGKSKSFIEGCIAYANGR